MVVQPGRRNGNGNGGHGHFGSPGGQFVLAGVGLAVGIMVTFATASIYLGGTFERISAIAARQDAIQKRLDVIDQSGAIRQIETNTARLNQIETVGSPTVATMKESLSNQSLRLAHVESVVAVLPNTDSTIQRDMATLRGDIAQNRILVEHFSNDLRSREFWEKLAGTASALEQQVKELAQTRDQGVVQWALVVQRVSALETRTSGIEDMLKNLREQVRQHDKDDNAELREQLNQFRALVIHRVPEIERDRPK